MIAFTADICLFDHNVGIGAIHGVYRIVPLEKNFDSYGSAVSAAMAETAMYPNGVGFVVHQITSIRDLPASLQSYTSPSKPSKPWDPPKKS